MTEPTRAASVRHPVGRDRQRVETAADALRTIAEPTRLQLLVALTAGPASVSELIEATGAGRTTVSQHLAKLRLSGLVEARKAGRNVIYSIHDRDLNRLIEEVLNYTGTRLGGELG